MKNEFGCRMKRKLERFMVKVYNVVKKFQWGLKGPNKHNLNK